MLNPKTKAVVFKWLHDLKEVTGDGAFATAAKVLVQDRGGRPQKANNSRLVREAMARLAANAQRSIPLSERQVLRQLAKDLAPYENPVAVAERVRRHLRKGSQQP